MPFDGNGTFLRIRNWVNDAAANIRIRADRHDSEDDNFALGLSQCVTKDGQTTITANLPMANFRHTNVGEAVNATDYARFDQIQEGKAVWADAGGTANAITATYNPATGTPVDGQLYYVRAGAANTTTTPTFAPDGHDAETIVKFGNTALVAGDIAGDGHELILRYRLSDTKYELLNPRGVILSDFGTAAFEDVGYFATAAQGALADTALQPMSQTGFISASRDLELTDANNILSTTGSDPITLTIPPNTSVNFPDFTYMFIQNGRTNGPLTLARGSGVQAWLHGVNADIVIPPRSTMILQKRNGDIWYAIAFTPAGRQIVSVDYTDNNSYTSLGNIPFDDTTPAIGEGTEVLSRSYPAYSATNRLRITVSVPIGGGTQGLCVALFQGSTLLRASPDFVGGTSQIQTITFVHEFVPGTTAAQTYSVRAGSAGGTTYLNGISANRLFGGASRATMVIEEIFAS